MKKLIYLIISFFLIPGLSFAQRGPWDSGSGSGVLIDSDCDQTKYYAIGKLCQDTDDGKLYKGTGAAIEEIAAGTDLTGIHAFTDQAEAGLSAEIVVTADGKSLVTAADYAAMRGLLDLEAGTDFNTYDADLTTYAGITPSANAQSLLVMSYAQMVAALEASIEGITTFTPTGTWDMTGLTGYSTDLISITNGGVIRPAAVTNAHAYSLQGYASAGTPINCISVVNDTGDTNPNVSFANCDFTFPSNFALPFSESADGTLTIDGQVHIRGDEDRISYDAGAGGEIAGEVTVSFLDMGSWSFDPGAYYDSDAEVFLFEVNSKVYPNGIIIDQWKCSCDVDPDVEINADLRYADAWIGLANAADIDEIDTTNGVSTEDTDASINSGGAAVAAGKVIYIGFDGDPEGTCVQMNFSMVWHAEED